MFKETVRFLRFKIYNSNLKIKCNVENLLQFTQNPFKKIDISLDETLDN